MTRKQVQNFSAEEKTRLVLKLLKEDIKLRANKSAMNNNGSVEREVLIFRFSE